METPIDEFKQVINTNLVGVFTMTRPVPHKMVDRKQGKIINICSMISDLGRDSIDAYAAAKGGLKTLSHNMATEWARYNVHVNGIGAGYFATTQTEPIRVEDSPLNEFIISRTICRAWPCSRH